MPGANRRQLLQSAAAALVAGPALAATPASVKRWDQEFDVVVVGFGVGGGCAALEAAKAGAKVLLLDPPGGQLSESHGGFFYLGGGTALQKELQVDDDQENYFRFLMSTYQPAPAEARIRQFCERNPEHYDWLIRLGLPFGKQRFETAWPTADGGGLFYSGEENSWPHNEVARPAQHCHVPVDGHGADKTFMRLLTDQTRAAGVVSLTVPAAKSLAVSADGRVEGVLAVVDGQSRSFRARRGVVLATGGFANNRAMVAQHLPHFLACSPSDGGGQGSGAPTAGAQYGWGHRAGMAVGAAVERMDGAVAYYGFYPPLSRKEGVLVNAQGQRFVPEDAYYGRIGTEIVLAQKGVAHFLLDGPSLGGLEPGLSGRGPAVAAQGSNLAEIERTLGLPETMLQSTLEFYNRHAARGVDPLFRKSKAHLRPLKPPFTVLKASVKDVSFTFFTVGGLSTNASGQVVDNEGTVIAGLYACGRVAAGIASPHYVSSGLSMSESTLTGRIAGLAAARQTA